MSISLNENVKFKNLKKGDVLFRENELSTQTYIISKGEVCSFSVKDLRVIPFYIFRENEILGDISSFNSNIYSENAIALTDCELIVIDNKDIEMFLNESSSWIKSILEEMSQKIINTQNTIKNHKIIKSDLFNGDFNMELETFLLGSL